MKQKRIKMYVFNSDQNREEIKATTDLNALVFYFARDEIRDDRNFYMEVLAKDGRGIVGANGRFGGRISKMADDKEACLLAAETFWDVLPNVSERLRFDKELVIKIAEKYGEFAVEGIHSSLLLDPEIVQALDK